MMLNGRASGFFSQFAPAEDFRLPPAKRCLMGAWAGERNGLHAFARKCRLDSRIFSAAWGFSLYTVRRGDRIDTSNSFQDSLVETILIIFIMIPMKRLSRKLTVVALTLASLAANLAWADQETIPFTNKSVSGSGCPGNYTGYASMTNSAGSTWITPPTNTTSGTFTDASGFPPPYVSVVQVTRKIDHATWCETNSVTFPATNSTSYQLVVDVKNTPPPPTNGQPMKLQITWQ